MRRFLPIRRTIFKAATLAGLVVAMAASARPAQAQVVVAPGAYPAYTTYGTYGYGARPYRPLRRALRPNYYARPGYYAPRVYAPAGYYAPVAPVYTAPARVYGPTVYYPPML